jgi:hypothetical protein
MNGEPDLFVGGRWRHASDGGSRAITNPADGSVVAKLMELAAKYPVAGSVYNWSKKLGSRIVGWSSGWLMLTASIVTISAVVLAYQLNLPRLWSGFQIIGDGTGEYDFAAILASFVIGGAILVFAVMSAPDLQDPKIGASSGGLQYIVSR